MWQWGTWSSTSLGKIREWLDLIIKVFSNRNDSERVQRRWNIPVVPSLSLLWNEESFGYRNHFLFFPFHCHPCGLSFVWGLRGREAEFLFLVFLLHIQWWLQGLCATGIILVMFCLKASESSSACQASEYDSPEELSMRGSNYRFVGWLMSNRWLVSSSAKI